jgi:hypothetical protein
MTDYPSEATLFRVAADRLAGKPFTLSEYNHPAPLDAQAECVPMIASFAAAQNWDAVWLFAYASGTSDWNRQTMSGYFDIDTNPGKWGFMRAGAAIFNGGSKPGDRESTTVPPTPDRAAAIARQQVKYGDNMLRMLTGISGITSDAMLRTQIRGWRMDDSGFTPQSTAINPQLQLKWSVDAAGRGIYQAVGQA